MIENLLKKELAHLSLSPLALQQLLTYLVLLEKWNKTYNLTAVRTIEDMVGLHIVDSLSVQSLITGQTILDMGTGAGLPGIPLAIFYPNKVWTLLDSNGKKTRFLQEVIRQLALKNVVIVHQRAEQYQVDIKFDQVIARAVGSVAELTKTAAHLVSPQGQCLWMKGQNPKDECLNLPYHYQIKPIEGLNLGERHVVIVNFAP